MKSVRKAAEIEGGEEPSRMELFRLLEHQSEMLQNQLEEIKRLTMHITMKENDTTEVEGASKSMEALKVMSIAKHVNIPTLKILDIENVRTFLDDLEVFRRNFPEASEVKIQSAMLGKEIIEMTATRSNKTITELEGLLENDFVKILKDLVGAKGITRLVSEIRKNSMSRENLEEWMLYDRRVSFLIECSEFKENKAVISAYCKGIKPEALSEECINMKFENLKILRRYVVKQLEIIQEMTDKGYLVSKKIESAPKVKLSTNKSEHANVGKMRSLGKKGSNKKGSNKKGSGSDEESEEGKDSESDDDGKKEWWKKVTCYRCGKTGHVARFCVELMVKEHDHPKKNKKKVMGGVAIDLDEDSELDW